MSEVVVQTGAGDGGDCGICPLLDALPVEIRIQIYEYILFENGNFFSIDDDDEGKSVPTLFPKLRAPPKTVQTEHVEMTSPRISDVLSTTRKGNIMSLLLTSKQIYTESAPVLYTHSFFRLRGIHSTIQFINNVAPSHLALVRSLKLVWDDRGWASAPEYDTPTLRAAWPSLCDAIATNLPALRNLYIALGIPSRELQVEALYLDGLRGISHVPNFKVCIPMGLLTRYYKVEWDDRIEGEEDEQGQNRALFELCRHTAGEICDIRKEVIEAEWLGARRPSTPRLKEQVPNVPGMQPWTDGEWDTAGDAAKNVLVDDGRHAWEAWDLIPTRL